MLITLSAEDNLSVAVARRLVGEYAPSAEIYQEFVAGGSVKSLIPGLNEMARYIGPVLALADLDRPLSCAPALVRELSHGLNVATGMMIRIVVMEIESWIMADREGFAKWLSIPVSVVSRDPESLDDPKRALVNLARRSRKRGMREAIAPGRVIGTHLTGRDYSDTVGEFVAHIWDPDAARRYSGSLERAVFRVAGLVGGYTG